MNAPKSLLDGNKDTERKTDEKFLACFMVIFSPICIDLNVICILEHPQRLALETLRHSIRMIRRHDLTIFDDNF